MIIGPDPDFAPLGVCVWGGGGGGGGVGWVGVAKQFSAF